jgi:hypothetical protein
METLTIEDRIVRLEKLISQLAPKKDEWVYASVITDLTGWSNEDLRKARRNGSVRFKIVAKGERKTTYKYLLGSIPSHFIIKKGDSVKAAS